MRTRLPWILFAISLALNLFFGAGVLYMKVQAESLGASPAARVEALAERLELTEVQRAGLVSLREQARERRRGLRGQFRQRRQAILAELSKPAFDRQAVRAALRQGMEQRLDLFESFAADLHAFLETLSEPQRQAFLDLAQERGFMRRLFGFRGQRERRERY